MHMYIITKTDYIKYQVKMQIGVVTGLNVTA